MSAVGLSGRSSPSPEFDCLYDLSGTESGAGDASTAESHVAPEAGTASAAVPLPFTSYEMGNEVARFNITLRDMYGRILELKDLMNDQSLAPTKRAEFENELRALQAQIDLFDRQVTKFISLGLSGDPSFYKNWSSKVRAELNCLLPAPQNGPEAKHPEAASSTAPMTASTAAGGIPPGLGAPAADAAPVAPGAPELTTATAFTLEASSSHPAAEAPKRDGTNLALCIEELHSCCRDFDFLIEKAFKQGNVLDFQRASRLREIAEIFLAWDKVLSDKSVAALGGKEYETANSLSQYLSDRFILLSTIEEFDPKMHKGRLMAFRDPSLNVGAYLINLKDLFAGYEADLMRIKQMAASAGNKLTTVQNFEVCEIRDAARNAIQSVNRMNGYSEPQAACVYEAYIRIYQLAFALLKASTSFAPRASISANSLRVAPKDELVSPAATASTAPAVEAPATGSDRTLLVSNFLGQLGEALSTRETKPALLPAPKAPAFAKVPVVSTPAAPPSKKAFKWAVSTGAPAAVSAAADPAVDPSETPEQKAARIKEKIKKQGGRFGL
jgi:hypothetical protein